MRPSEGREAKAGGRLRQAGAALAALGLLMMSGLGAVRLSMVLLGPPPLASAAEVSVAVLDRNDALLRAFTTPGGRWRLPVDPGDVDPRYVAMLLAFEDRHFQSHGGIDWMAVLRAGWQAIGHGRIVSGASTLTMQVARLIDGGSARSFPGKWRQAIRALQLERELSKSEILSLYLRLAPFGGNLEGVRAAALAYFGIEPRRLSAGGAALLVALPQSPEARRPDRFPEAARRARDRVIERAEAAGVLGPEEAGRARAETLPRVRREFPKLAAHLAEAIALERPADRVHRLTLDKEMQQRLEALTREHARRLGRRLSAALLVVDHSSGEVRAHVGSADYFDETRLGAIDMARAIRSPGSTLKPIIYGLAFEAGLAHPETIIEDRPTRFGLYRPQNFDEEFRGSVTMREALAHSLNIPAVKVLSAVGPARLIARLRRVGVRPVLPGQEEPTLAIALGGVGLSLRDLAALYGGLARGGDVVGLSHRRQGSPAVGTPGKPPVRRVLLTPLAAWYVADILKDAPAPSAASGGRFAYKTGTSYGYRDAWAVGFDGRHTVAVWIGRADGSSTPALTGRAAAAPLLFDAFQRLGQPAPRPLDPPPPGALRVSGAELPPPLKRFASQGEEVPGGPYEEPPVLIAFPPDRAELDLPEADDVLQLKAEGGVLPLTWMVDGAPIPSQDHLREAIWRPGGRGFVKVTVSDARGRVDRVLVRLR